jgi:hypothetical protein
MGRTTWTSCFVTPYSAKREESFYVDHVAVEGSLAWLSPARTDELNMGFTPASVLLVAALEDLGVFNQDALDAIGRVWSGFVPEATTR